MNAIVKSDIYTYDGKEIEMNYYTDISISNKMNFVSFVVSTVVGDGYYYPMLRDIIFDFQLVNFFSDVDTGIDDSTDDIFDRIEDFLDKTDVADILKANINFDVLVELNNSVDKAIEYRTGIHPSPIADALASLFDTIEQKFTGVDMSSMTDMAKVFAKMQGDITPDKMLDAYADSDLFKLMHDDVVSKQRKRDIRMDEIRKEVNEVVSPSVADGNIINMKNTFTVYDNK